MKRSRHETEQPVELSPRNSRLRNLSKEPATKVVAFLNKVFPWLTPNEITILGTAGVGALSLYVTRLEKEGRIDNKTAVKIISSYLALSGTDFLDGSLARYLAETGQGTHDSSVGQLVDSLSDRVQEAFSAWMAMYLAAHRGDKIWLITATLSAFTNPLSSLVRAYAEKHGIVVPETGKGIEMLGNRVGRVAASTTRFLPESEVGPTSAQALIDGLTSVATLKTTASRIKAVRKRDAVQALDAKSVAEAKRRFRLLSGLALLTGTTTSVLLYKLLKNNK